MPYFRQTPEPPRTAERSAWSGYVVDLQAELMAKDPSLEPSVARRMVYDKAKADLYRAYPMAYHVRMLGQEPE